MLAALDPFTLGLAVAFTLFTIAIQSLLFQLTTRSYAGSHYWTASLVVMALAFLSLVLRGRIPDLISILGTNYGGFLGLCLFYDGLVQFHGRVKGRSVNLLNHGLAVAVMALMLYYTVAEPNVNMRVAQFNAFQLFIAIRMMTVLAQARHSRHRTTSILLLGVFLALACISLVRIYTALYTPVITSFVKDDVGLRGLMLFYLVLASAMWFGIMLMTHSRTESELDEARRKAEIDSRTDRLTSLWNRYHFEAEIRREIERSTRYNQPATLLLFDIDHFKQVNDRYGHLAGDEILKEVARCARDAMRVSDLLCRWGGEEFVALVPAADSEAAAAADKLRQAIEAHAFPVAGKITVSVGVAQLRVSDDVESWMRRADKALYRAKALGRNRVEKETHDFALASPMSLQWVPGFTCGDAVLDEQHLALFNKANRLLERCRSADGNQIAIAMEIVLQEAERHFAYEESVLRKVEYPRLGEHVAEHERLARKARKLLEEFRAGKKTAGALSSFVVSELAFGHIAEEDASYVSFIRERASKEREAAPAGTT